MVEKRKEEKFVELTEYDEIGDFSFVIRCDCGKWQRVKVPILICKPKTKQGEYE